MSDEPVEYDDDVEFIYFGETAQWFWGEVDGLDHPIPCTWTASGVIEDEVMNAKQPLRRPGGTVGGAVGPLGG